VTGTLVTWHDHWIVIGSMHRERGTSTRAASTARPPGTWRLDCWSKWTTRACSPANQRPPTRFNLLIDSPRYTRRLTEKFDATGGIAVILLSHRDDVAHVERWAEHYHCDVYIHTHDADAAPFATHVVTTENAEAILEGVTVIAVPGHTRGSVVYLIDDRWLFTGDSLAWNSDHQRLTAFRDGCWFSWPAQKSSLARLATHPFERVFAGHGSWSPPLTVDAMHDALSALVERM
jgi:glyoxylase-like metal-dependent hydrolase (beta-lactamase superfamily II)